MRWLRRAAAVPKGMRSGTEKWWEIPILYIYYIVCVVVNLYLYWLFLLFVIVVFVLVVVAAAVDLIIKKRPPNFKEVREC